MATVMMMNKAESESLSSYNSEVEEKHVRHIDNEVVDFYIFFMRMIMMMLVIVFLICKSLTCTIVNITNIQTIIFHY